MVPFIVVGVTIIYHFTCGVRARCLLTRPWYIYLLVFHSALEMKKFIIYCLYLRIYIDKYIHSLCILWERLPNSIVTSIEIWRKVFTWDVPFFPIFAATSKLVLLSFQIYNLFSSFFKNMEYPGIYPSP